MGTVHARATRWTWWLSWKELGLHGSVKREVVMWYGESVVGTDVYSCWQTRGVHGGVVAVNEGLLLRADRGRYMQTGELAGLRRGRHVGGWLRRRRDTV